MDNSRSQNCLVLVQSFETLWAYYSQSDGQIYDAECRQTATALVESLSALFGADDDFRARLDETTVNRVRAGDIIDMLERWGSGDTLVPFESFRASRSLLFGFFSALKLSLHVALQIPFPPTIAMSSSEIEHSERALRWKGYLPDEFLHSSRYDPDKLVKDAGLARSIVVIVDIRRSQHLMAYTGDADRFSGFMGRFLDQSRFLIRKHHGFFDKFTGDGFIAYFNEEICGQLDTDYIDSFIRFVQEEAVFVHELFDEWLGSVETIISEPIGLAMGADIGVVDFRDVKNHLIAIGDAVVWAHRMAGAGGVGEIVVREPLWQVIESTPGIESEIRTGETKNGIPFDARAITFNSA